MTGVNRSPWTDHADGAGRVLLAMFLAMGYFAVLTPVAVAVRLVADPLRRGWTDDATYWRFVDSQQWRLETRSTVHYQRHRRRLRGRR